MNEERIGGIYFQLFEVQRIFDADPDGGEAKFDALMRELQGLGVFEEDIDRMIAATELNPQLRQLHMDLFVNQPRQPDESRRAHLRRILGEAGDDIANELNLPA